MPFKSKAQQRAAFGGYIPGFSKEKALEWAHETKNLKKLPEHVKKAELEHTLVKLCSIIMAPKAVAPALRAGTVPKATSTRVTQQISNAAKAGQNGRFGGMMTPNSLKPPGPAAVGQAVNPTMNLRTAMKPKTAIPGAS